tara:strand:- start:1932 stop:2420 length:489 start_codon:yes stop_codon:yes gene_type:complete
MSAHYEFERKMIKDSVLGVLYDHMKMIQIMFIRIIKKILSQQGGGKQYKGAPTRSSAPWEAPATQTGTLRGSWGIMTPISKTRDGLSSWMEQKINFSPSGSSPIKYGMYLEYGTKHMRPRPHVKPAIEETQNWSDRNLYLIEKQISRTLERLLIDGHMDPHG